jgi:hypothetical protein
LGTDEAVLQFGLLLQLADFMVQLCRLLFLLRALLLQLSESILQLLDALAVRLLVIAISLNAGLVVLQGRPSAALVELVAALLHLLLGLVNLMDFVLIRKSITRLASHSLAFLSVRSSLMRWFSSRFRFANDFFCSFKYSFAS